MTRFLDHRGKTYIRLTEGGIARFGTKKEAATFAREHGWYAKDASAAANRFFYFWVVCQCVGDSARYLSKEGKVIEDGWPGYLRDCDVP